jgi:NAD(P)H-nitrite reductase large subunit
VRKILPYGGDCVGRGERAGKEMKQFIIIGNSAAGIAAVESIRDKDRDSKITVISDEDYTAYCRCVLSYYLAGETPEANLVYRPKEFYKEKNIELLLNKKVTRVDPQKNSVVLEGNVKLGYDKLLIATGASPKFPEIKGIHKRGVSGFRTIKDIKEVLGIVPVSNTAVCLGGGLIGLKAAYALKKRGLEVKVIVKSKQILSQLLDKAGADIIQGHLESHGIEILTGADISEFVGEGELKAIKLDSGKVIGCQIAIIGKGVSPNVGLVKNTNIRVDEGIVLDSSLKTSIDTIFAAGDCAQAYDIAAEKNQVNALWPNAVEQGALAGKNIAGENRAYLGSIGMNSVDFFDLPIISMGIVKEEEGMEVLSSLDAKNKVYKKVVLKDNRVKGAILLGKIENSGIFLRLIKDKVDVSALKKDLLDDSFNYAKVMDLFPEKEKIYLCLSGGENV